MASQVAASTDQSRRTVAGIAATAATTPARSPNAQPTAATGTAEKATAIWSNCAKSVGNATP